MRYIGFLAIIILTSGCVLQKKYDELLAERIKLESQLQECNGKLSTSNSKADSLESLSIQLARDTAQLNSTIQKTATALSTLKEEHSQLQTYYDNLVNNSGKLNRDLAEQQKNLMAIRDNLEKTRQLNEQLNADLELREKKMNELEELIAKEAALAQNLKKKISNALLNFQGNDLSIEVKNGRIYVSLAEKLLFKSGSIMVDAKGVEALKQLAQAIKSQKDIDIMVEGHTDNVSIAQKEKYFQDNWDLSVLRATSIVRIITKSGVDPQQIIAAGKGKFTPVTDNDNKEGRAKNRRTEIIITPNLDELFAVINDGLGE